MDEAIELARCRKDRSYKICKHTIKTEDANVRTIDELSLGQRKLAALLHYCRHVWEIPPRIEILKSRKHYITTYCQADLYEELKSVWPDADLTRLGRHGHCS